MHLYEREDLPIVSFHLENPGRTGKRFVVKSEIEEFSFSRTDGPYLGPGREGDVPQLPRLNIDKIRTLYDVRLGIIHTWAHVIEDVNKVLIWEQDFEVTFRARDVIIWAIIERSGKVHDLSKHIAAWVTPNDPDVVHMLRKAAEHHPSKEFVGYQGVGSEQERAALVREQVKAIFTALKEDAEIAYVNAPAEYGKRANDVSQRVSFPKDSLENRQANCVDGVVLYASLIERAGLNPVIVLIPGHALVGWETWDGTSEYEYLDTTLTGSETFEAAAALGAEIFGRYQAVLGRPLFDPGGFAVQHDVKALHEEGILPLG